MKGVVLVIIFFLLCALVGYQVATQIDQSIDGGQDNVVSSTEESTTPQAKQYNVILIHVDRLDRPQPRMVSVWFVSLYFIDGGRPTLTFAQMYPSPGNPEPHQAFERSFSLNRQGAPVPGFWKAVKTLGVQWKGYLLVDDFTVQSVMEWTGGAGDYPGLLGATQNNPQESKQALMQTCEAFGMLESYQPAPFALNDLIPAHFRSDLQMEEALSYWNMMTTSALPIKCEVLLAP